MISIQSRDHTVNGEREPDGPPIIMKRMAAKIPAVKAPRREARSARRAGTVIGRPRGLVHFSARRRVFRINSRPKAWTYPLLTAHKLHSRGRLCYIGSFARPRAAVLPKLVGRSIVKITLASSVGS